jgi:hypothetical protein
MYQKYREKANYGFTKVTSCPVIVNHLFSTLSRTIMKANYKFQNLCGTVYRQGNVVFTPDGNSVLSPVGNRVSVFDLVKLVSIRVVKYRS